MRHPHNLRAWNRLNLWTNVLGVTTQMKPQHQHFHIVLFVFSILQNRTWNFCLFSTLIIFGSETAKTTPELKSDPSEHHTGSGKSRTEILPLLPGWPSCSWPSCWGGRSGLWSAEGSSDLLLVVGVHPSDASPVSCNSFGFLQLVLFHCQGLLPIPWPGVKTTHFIWVSMYLAPKY